LAIGKFSSGICQGFLIAFLIASPRRFCFHWDRVIIVKFTRSADFPKDKQVLPLFFSRSPSPKGSCGIADRPNPKKSNLPFLVDNIIPLKSHHTVINKIFSLNLPKIFQHQTDQAHHAGFLVPGIISNPNPPA
jgi:hypothetical protein